MRIHSSNPVYRSVNNALVSDRPVTYTNVALKTVFLVFIAMGTGYYFIANPDLISIPLLIGAIIVGFIAVIIGSRSVRLAPYLSILYAACEGLVLGIVSVLYESLYEGIVPTALITTVVVLLIMMTLYSMNIIKVNARFASFMVVALISVIIMSLIGMLLPFGGGALYIIISIVSALLSALYLFLDFENIKTCVNAQADVSYGWILALGMMVSLVWIYIEILRLLAIFGNHRN
ncbi:MAG: Bax inhibitor-1/YccA family protein [Candidatus Izemoplasmatales bacterium]|nr:Bax inhibitor-1/YccA family protein [Candidatus Izemoplasmatales bacterium]MDD3865846.1 Bax inhibitor-1/YccA family protein [Candidatus Izemoplasmatales bacterium]